MDEITIKIWKVHQFDGSTIRVATIEQGQPKRPNLCEGCPAPCCRGMYAEAVLNGEEFINKKYDYHFSPIPEDLKELGVNVDFVVSIGNFDGICQYFNRKTWTCKLGEDRPASCKSYFCGEDPRPFIKAFYEKWSKEKDRKTWRDRNGWCISD